jgi:hypothetical protein
VNGKCGARLKLLFIHRTHIQDSDN